MLTITVTAHAYFLAYAPITLLLRAASLSRQHPSRVRAGVRITKKQGHINKDRNTRCHQPANSRDYAHQNHTPLCLTTTVRTPNLHCAKLPASSFLYQYIIYLYTPPLSIAKDISASSARSSPPSRLIFPPNQPDCSIAFVGRYSILRHQSICKLIQGP